MNFKVVIAAALFSLPCIIAKGQTFSTAVAISADAGAHSPAMHVGRDGTIFVSWFENNADIYFSRSSDNGMTFSPPVRVSRQVTTNNFTSLLQRVPNFAIDTNGTIHLVWMEGRILRPGSKQEETDVWYARSTDKGATWTQPFNIIDADDSDLYAQDFPAIAIDSSNNLYVCYIDNRYLERGIVPHYKLQCERSTDGGKTWSKPVIADKLPFENAGTCECCRTDIAASPDGHIYTAFRTNMTEPTGDKRDIYIARSMDGGLTFDSSIQCQLGDWTLDACPTKGPQIALDKNENLHIAWADARDDSGKLATYYAALSNGASEVLANSAVSYGTPNATWPDVAIAPDGTIAYAYTLDFGGGPCRFSYSSDGGKDWKRTINFPGGSSDVQSIPALAFDGAGNLYAAWQAGTANGILAARVMLPAAGVNGAASRVEEVYPNPVTNGILKIVEPGTLSDANVVIYDDRGTLRRKEIATASIGSVSVDVRDLAPGVYVCELLGASPRHVRFIIP